MLQIERNGEQLNLGYTVENNLLPSTDGIKKILKNGLYCEGYSRTNSHNNFIYLPNMTSIFRTSKVKPSLFTYGSIELLDEENQVLGNVDLHSAYSGESTVRGSINLSESFNIMDDNKVKTRLVIDFPTHASNGNIKKIALKPQNPYRTEYLGTKDSEEYDVKYSNESVSTTSDVSLVFDKDYNLMVAHKKFINYKGKMYYFGQAENKRIVCTGTKYYYIDSNIGIDSSYNTPNTFTITEIIFNESTLTVSKGETHTITFEHFEYSSYRYYNLIGFKEIDGVVRFAIMNCNSSYTRIKFVDYNLDTFKFIEQTDWIRVSNYYTVVDRFDVPLDENNIYRVHGTGTSPIGVDFSNKTVITLEEFKGCMTSLSKEINGQSYNATRGWLVDNEGNEYTCYRHNVSTNATAGYGHHYKILKKTNETWKPLTITLDEPIVKNAEQTLKIVLNIEID